MVAHDCSIYTAGMQGSPPLPVRTAAQLRRGPHAVDAQRLLRLLDHPEVNPELLVSLPLSGLWSFVANHRSSVRSIIAWPSPLEPM
jgi:hypothetical protein